MKNTNITSTIRLVREELSKAIIALENESKQNILSDNETQHIRDLTQMFKELLSSNVLSNEDSDDYDNAEYYSSPDADNYYMSEN